MTNTFASLKENERQAFQIARKDRLTGWFDTHFHEIFELPSYSDESGPLSHVELRGSKQEVCPARRDNTGGSGLKRVVQASGSVLFLKVGVQYFCVSYSDANTQLVHTIEC